MRTGRVMRKRGFTLVETVVTVGIVAALAAVVYPTVVKQFDSADPTKASEDLNNIRTGIEMFAVNLRPHQPGDMEDLTNKVNSAEASLPDDSTALGTTFDADSNSWNGPYIAAALARNTTDGATVFNTGFDGAVQNRFILFDADASDGGAERTTTQATVTATLADFVAIKITGLSYAAFESINAQLDGPSETTETLIRHSGKFRCIGTFTAGQACAAAYYLASPLRQ